MLFSYPARLRCRPPVVVVVGVEVTAGVPRGVVLGGRIVTGRVTGGCGGDAPEIWVSKFPKSAPREAIPVVGVMLPNMLVRSDPRAAIPCINGLVMAVADGGLLVVVVGSLIWARDMDTGIMTTLGNLGTGILMPARKGNVRPPSCSFAVS